MKKLLLTRNDKFADPNKPDVTIWHDIYNLLNLNVSLVDRCDVFTSPYSFHNQFPIPRDLNNFNKSYDDLCIERALAIVEHSKQVNKPIVIFFSGGIDSTIVVISFLIALSGNTRDIFIAMNNSSLAENPNFYYNHIRGRFQLMASEQALDMLNGKYIVVGGEFNDQLFGSDIVGTFRNQFGMDAVFEPYAEKNIIPFLLKSGMQEKNAKVWFDMLDQHIKKTNLAEIITVKDFFWWLNFSFKWQSVYYRIISRTSNRSIINQNFVNDHYFQFFDTLDFQRWSMLNQDKKIGKTWETYKLAGKNFIFAYTQDKEYYNNKMKIGSLSGIFRQRHVPDALCIDSETGELIFTDVVNPEEFYLPDNDFQKFVN